MHRAIIWGNLGRDPELRYTQNGKADLNFPIASSNGKDDQGQDRPPTWFDCVMWGDDAIKFQGLSKGDNISLTGRIKADAWTANDGTVKSKIVITVDTISAHAAPGAIPDQNQSEPAPPPTGQPSTGQPPPGGPATGQGGNGQEGAFDDEIPF